MCELNWQNAFMVTLEGGSAAAGVIALFHSLPLAGCLFVLSGSLCMVQGCWARDRRIADMSRVADKLEDDDIVLGKTVNLVKQVEARVDVGAKTGVDEQVAPWVRHQGPGHRKLAPVKKRASAVPEGRNAVGYTSHQSEDSHFLRRRGRWQRSHVGLWLR